jgi:hypothetical protein
MRKQVLLSDGSSVDIGIECSSIMPGLNVVSVRNGATEKPV